ncbi:hypothetical protein MBLNU459_g8293t1 [Dothideomycetes sp. NU459]
MGSKDNEQDLTLAGYQLNAKKGQWFDLNHLATNGGNDLSTKLQIREGAGTFSYLNYDGQGTSAVSEWVWNKFMRPSNWVDLVLYEFDKYYAWQSRAGEPTTSTGGNPSLRYLYSKFMDA